MDEGNICKRLDAVIDRLEAWIDGEKHAQDSAERRQDRPSAEIHYNQWRNYQGMADTLRDIRDDLT